MYYCLCWFVLRLRCSAWLRFQLLFFVDGSCITLVLGGGRHRATAGRALTLHVARLPAFTTYTWCGLLPRHLLLPWRHSLCLAGWLYAAWFGGQT